MESTRQWFKHQIGTTRNEVSRRYVDDEPEFYVPETWRKRAENVKQGSSDEAVKYNSVVAIDADYITKEALKVYKGFLENGVCPEQARMVLPQNTMTEWMWSGTLGAFADMCRLRLDSHSQKETREVAEKISNEMNKIYPVSWKALLEV